MDNLFFKGQHFTYDELTHHYNNFIKTDCLNCFRPFYFNSQVSRSRIKISLGAKIKDTEGYEVRLGMVSL